MISFPRHKRSKVTIFGDKERRLAEMAELRAQSERMKETSDRIRDRIARLRARLREMDDCKEPGRQQERQDQFT